MASLTDQAKFAVREGIIHKIRQAVITVAIAVAAEEKSGNEAVDRARLALASNVLRQPDKWARTIVYGVVTDSRIKSNASDTVFTNVVASLWNAYAGVNPNHDY
jgi:hypothetical protein